MGFQDLIVTLKMSKSPVKVGSVKLRKCALLKNRLLLGIDSGSSMTKIVFIDKKNKEELLDDNSDVVTISNVLFNNRDFEDAIKWTLEHAFLPKESQYSVHLTGAGARNKKNIIASILGLESENIDEMLTIATGHKVALEQIGLAQLKSAPVNLENVGRIDSKMFEKFAEGMKSKFEQVTSDANYNSDDIFPCVIHVYGSASGFYYFDREGKGEFASCLLTGGRSFMGLCKCLLDTNNYDEIMELASKGDRGNVDTQVKDIFSDDPNSPYGQFPPDMPIMAFGKCMDLDLGLETLSKEDLAASLIAYFAHNMLIHCSQIALTKMTTRIFLTGNIFRSNLFKKEIQRILTVFPFMPACVILDFGYFGALGAMLCNNEDKDDYYKS